jgi:rubredoxin
MVSRDWVCSGLPHQGVVVTNPNEFRCSACGQVYVKAWSDEKARAEAEMYWPDVALEEMAVICDDCWLRGMKRTIDTTMARVEAAHES